MSQMRKKGEQGSFVTAGKVRQMKDYFRLKAKGLFVKKVPLYEVEIWLDSLIVKTAQKQKVKKVVKPKPEPETESVDKDTE